MCYCALNPFCARVFHFFLTSWSLHRGSVPRSTCLESLRLIGIHFPFLMVLDPSRRVVDEPAYHARAFRYRKCRLCGGSWPGLWTDVPKRPGPRVGHSPGRDPRHLVELTVSLLDIHLISSRVQTAKRARSFRCGFGNLGSCKLQVDWPEGLPLNIRLCLCTQRCSPSSPAHWRTSKDRTSSFMSPVLKSSSFWLLGSSSLRAFRARVVANSLDWSGGQKSTSRGCNIDVWRDLFVF